MAIFYTPYYTTGTYTRTRIKVEYSGTWATATLLYTRDNAYYTAAGSPADFHCPTSLTASFAGFSSTGPVTDLEVCHNTFVISTSGGTYDAYTTGNAGLYAYNPNNLDEYKVHIPAQGSAPSNGYINNLYSYWDHSKKEVVLATTMAGVADGGLSLTELDFNASAVPYEPGVTTKLHRNFTSLNNSPVVTSNTLNNYTGTTFNMQPNMTIYSGLYAQNTAGVYRFTTSAGAPSLVTVPAEADVTLTTTGIRQQSMSVTFPADGGVYAKDFYYRLNGGAWVQLDTITGSGQVTRSYTITGLTDDTLYMLETKTETLAGSTECNQPLFFITPIDPNLYGSVSSAATHINKLYGSSGGSSAQIRKLYGSVNGEAKPVFIRHVHE